MKIIQSQNESKRNHKKEKSNITQTRKQNGRFKPTYIDSYIKCKHSQNGLNKVRPKRMLSTTKPL